MTDSSTERETLHLNGAKAIPIDLTLAGPMADLTIVTQNEANRTVFHPKRNQPPKRQERCSFCQGNDNTNKHGQPELMATCITCGRSGHPTCMDLGPVGAIMHSYPWKCIECKTCEICYEKGDDARILFCDFCDRGWHMDCLSPPLEKAPTGKWHCPMCPPLPPPEIFQALPPTRYS